MQRIGRFEVIETLGQGGAGLVVRARDPQLGREVAVKLLLDVDSERSRQRFRTEGAALVRLRHANLLTVHEAGESQGRPYLVLALVEGTPLDEVLRQGALAPDRAVEVVHRLSDAVAAVHAAGLLHRDLKPANVILREDGEPVLVDFGLARDLQADAAGPTQTGAVLGTPGYWSPEQAAGMRHSMGPRTDVYGLGAVLYACLTGRPPIEARDFTSALVAAARTIPDLPSASHPEVPAALDAICLKCLAKSPDDRYPHAAALRDDLARFQRGEAVEALPPGSASSQPALLGGGLLVLAALALLAALAWRSAARSAQPTPRAATPTSTRIDPAKGKRLRELFASDWLPERLEREAAVWAAGVVRGHGAGEAAQLKREIWREVRPSAQTRLLADANPAAALRRLGAVLRAPPALEGELAAISSAAFGPLRARWEAQDEAAYPAALGLQRARIALELGEAPLWLQQEAYSRFSEEGGVIDCLQLGVPIRPGFAFAMVKRFNFGRLGGLGHGQLGLYLQLSRYDLSAFMREEPGAAFEGVCELWETLGARPRDLGQRYVHEIECIGLRAAGSRLTWRLGRGQAAEAEARRLLARCLELREPVRYELVYELASVEQELRLLLEDDPGTVELWTDVLRRIERDRDRPRAGPFWFPDHLRGRSLVRLGLAQLTLSPRAVLKTCATLNEVVAKVAQVARDAGYTSFSSRALELERARLAIDAYRRLQDFEPAFAEIQAHVGIGSVAENASLGIQAAELYLAARDPERVEWALGILRKAKIHEREPNAFASLEEQLATLRRELGR